MSTLPGTREETFPRPPFWGALWGLVILSSRLHLMGIVLVAIATSGAARIV